METTQYQKFLEVQKICEDLLALGSISSVPNVHYITHFLDKSPTYIPMYFDEPTTQSVNWSDLYDTLSQTHHLTMVHFGFQHGEYV